MKPALDVNSKHEHRQMPLIGAHIGMYARNPASLAQSYCDVMGMQVMGATDASHPLGATAFLSSRPGEESHEIAMFSNPELAHRAFKMESLAVLKRFFDSPSSSSSFTVTRSRSIFMTRKAT